MALFSLDLLKDSLLINKQTGGGREGKKKKKRKESDTISPFPSVFFFLFSPIPVCLLIKSKDWSKSIFSPDWSPLSGHNGVLPGARSILILCQPKMYFSSKHLSHVYIRTFDQACEQTLLISVNFACRLHSIELPWLHSNEIGIMQQQNSFNSTQRQQFQF